eukprot:jgi/Hompol1/999/HPOL_005484-RA
MLAAQVKMLSSAVAMRPRTLLLVRPTLSLATPARLLSSSDVIHCKRALSSAAFEISTKGLKNINDLAKAIKLELPNQLRTVDVNQISIHLPGTTSLLQPDITLDGLPLLCGFEPNTYRNPLEIKVIPPPLKTIYVQDLDDGIKPLDIFSQYRVMSDKDIDRIVEGKGNFLRPVDQPDVAISRFEQLIEGGRYTIYSKSAIAQVEKPAAEVQSNERHRQARVRCGLVRRSTLNLCECKHCMSQSQV